MNKHINFINGIIIGFLIFSLVGCSGLTGKNKGVYGNASKKQDTQKDKIEAIEKGIVHNEQERLTKIGAWAEGTTYALDKIDDPPKEVVIAKDVNDRIKALSNKPNFDEIKEVQVIIDGLLSDFKSEQDRSKRQLAAKDNEIQRLSEKLNALNTAKESEITKYMKIAEENARKTDQYKETLSEMDSFLGFGAMWYGVKKFVTSSTIFLAIGLLLYLVLRVFAATNPAVGAIFGIFEQIFAGIIKLIQGIAPRALQFAGNVSTKMFEGYKNTLVRLVDSIELMREREKVNGVKKYTIDDLFTEISKNMDQADKDRISIIKKELKW